MSKKTFVFDAYGTLLNLDSVTGPYYTRLGPCADDFKKLWRTKQLEYSWLLSLMGRYENFWDLTRKALDYTCETFGVKDDSLKEKLLSSYRRAKFYEDALDVLRDAKAQGSRVIVLTNAPKMMFESALEASEEAAYIDTLLTADDVRVFKPSPSVYRMVLGQSVRKEDVVFCSSNGWDVAGARSFGFYSVWINRNDAPAEQLSIPPDRVLRSLEGMKEAFFQKDNSDPGET